MKTLWDLLRTLTIWATELNVSYHQYIIRHIGLANKITDSYSLRVFDDAPETSDAFAVYLQTTYINGDDGSSLLLLIKFRLTLRKRLTLQNLERPLLCS